MVSKRGILIFSLVLFLGLTLVFMFPYRQLIRDSLAEPLAYYLWYLQKVWKSLDSDIVWGFFILIVYAIILMAFPTFRSFPGRSAPDELVNQESRLDFWLYEVQRLVSQPEFNRFSVVALKKLVLDVIAFREQFETRQEAEQWLMDHEQNVPPEVVALFDRKITSRADQPGWSVVRIWRSLWPWKNSHSVFPPQTKEKISVIIQFLENQFEMHHDHPYR